MLAGKDAEQGEAEQPPSRCVSLLGFFDTLDGLCLMGDTQSSDNACAWAFRTYFIWPASAIDAHSGKCSAN
jgi:hypothetical protein